jgi:hypothetical protein
MVLAGMLGTASGLQCGRVASQAASPAPVPESFLFVQVASAGSARAVDGDLSSFDLTLTHESNQTLAFSDRPERIATLLETSGFMSKLATLASNPPNAAFVFSAPDGSDERVAVRELVNPESDSEAGTIHYRVRVIDPAVESVTLGPSGSDPVVDRLPSSFGHATLFIDNVLQLYNDTRVERRFSFGRQIASNEP